MGGFWGGRCSRSLGGRILGKTLLKKLRWEDAGRTLFNKLRWEDDGEDAAQEA